MEQTGILEKGKKLVKVNPADLSFKANGKKYYIETSLSVDRWKEKDALELQLGLGVSFNDVMTRLREVWELLNKLKLAEAIVKIYDIMNGLTNIEKRHSPILLYCTLFINEENEDRRYWNLDLANSKLKDWNEEGIDVGFFLTIAFSSVKGLKEFYLKTSQDFSNENQTEENQEKKK